MLHEHKGACEKDKKNYKTDIEEGPRLVEN